MNTHKIEKLLFFITLALNVFFLLLVFGQIDEHEINIYIWSDTLYLPSIFKDLFVDGTGFGTWNLNGAPNFFPDMPLYFIINAFTDNFIVALFTFSLTQYLYLLLFSFLFLRSFFPRMPLYSITLGFLLMLLFFYITTITNNFVYTFYIVSVSFHLSAYILALVCAWQAALYFRTGKIRNIIIYAVIAFLAALSDKLFLVIFSIPSLLWLLLLTKKAYRKSIFIITLVTFVTGILSIITYNLINLSSAISFITTSGKTFQFNNAADSYKVMFGQHWTYIKNLDIRGLVAILSLISFFISVVLLFSKRKILFSKTAIDKTEFLEICYLLFFIGSVFLTFNAPAINGYYVSWAILRFNVYALYLSVLNFSFISYILIRNFNKAEKIVIVPLIILLTGFAIFHGALYSVKTKTPKGLDNFFNYTPGWVTAIDSVCVARDLDYGVSEYVFAKHFTMFSKHDKRIYTVHTNLRPWHHVTNEDWYYGGVKGKFSKPEFKFIITEKLETEKIYNKLQNYIVDTIELKEHGLHILITEPFIFERDTKDIIMLKDSVRIINK